MRNFVILIIFLALTLNLKAQSSDSTVIKITLSAQSSGTAVKNAQVKLVSSKNEIKRYSDLTGDAYFYYGEIQGKSFLDIRHPYYSDTLIENFNKLLKKAYDDTFYVDLKLDFGGQMNDEFTLFSEKLPDTIFGSEKVSVADFELLPNGDILLLAYEKKLTKNSDLYLFSNGEIVSTYRIPDKAKELTRDFRGNVHVVCKNDILSINIDKYKKVSLGKIDKKYFFKYIAPIVDTNDAKMYFSNYSDVYPAFEYYSFDQLDSTYVKLLNIQDELMMELFRAEYRWVDVRTKLWAREMESQTGIDKVVWVGANYFTQSLYYEELYAPLFKRNDSLFVFDHYKEYIYSFDLEGKVLDSVPIFYHLNEKNTGWKKELLQDNVTGQIFSIYERAGYSYLKHINTKDGSVSSSQRLHFRYVDKIEIRDNKIYYIYRPFESLQKKYLYEEELKNPHPKSEMNQGDEMVKNTGK